MPDAVKSPSSYQNYRQDEYGNWRRQEKALNQALSTGDASAAGAGGSTTASPFSWSQGNVMNILGGYSHTPQGLKDAYAAHPELGSAGSKIGGSKGDKILDPTTGRWVDVIRAAGAGGLGWQWLDETPSSGGGGGSTLGSSMPGGGYTYSGMSPNEMLRMVMGNLALNRVLWNNPMTNGQGY